MSKLPLRGSIMLALVALVAALVAASAQAGTVIGLLDVTKQVARIQERVDKLTAAGQTIKTGVLTAKAVCGDPPSSQVFAGWGDTSEYVLAPTGSLEAVGGWAWGHDSRLISDNNPFSAGSSALFLGNEGQAVSPAMCVTTRHPSIRFFAKNTGAADSLLSVSVLYEDTNGRVQRLKVATLTGTSAWAPTISIPYKVNLLAAASPNGVTAVSFLFEASKGKGNSGRKLQLSAGNDHHGRPDDNDGHKSDGGGKATPDVGTGHDDGGGGEGERHGNTGAPTTGDKHAADNLAPAAPSAPSGSANTIGSSNAPAKRAVSDPGFQAGNSNVSGWEIDDLYVDPFKTN